MFHATKLVGRWVFLTRHTIAIQSIHAVATLIVSFGWCPQLCAGVHSSSIFIAGLGLFVTSQFFALVAGHPEFVEGCRYWADKGVPFRSLMYFMHLPCGVFALVDILVIKQRHFLAEHSPQLTHLLAYYLCYVVVYLVIVHVNHAYTNAWPYGFMKDLTTPGKWVKFTVVQFTILAVFVSTAAGLCIVVPPLVSWM
eukprot:TRINITY_DN10259_c0_g1_i1.p1 TRINITY_DN10259_c0_g1~~TRINITY_DN10259_c0_g1_i1.p1  ORF type:complete len:196 (-),score=25.29 TRINITY_DN10259_c0_g1_i1:178-765(-)